VFYVEGAVDCRRGEGVEWSPKSIRELQKRSKATSNKV